MDIIRRNLLKTAPQAAVGAFFGFGRETEASEEFVPKHT